MNPFQNLYLRGVGKADGKDYVLIQSLSDNHAMKPFIANEPGEDGIVVKLVRFGSNFRETRVVLEKGPDTGEIGFQENTINAPQAAPNARRGPAGMPGQIQKPGAPPMPMPMQFNAVRASQPVVPTNPIPSPGISSMPAPMFGQPSTVPQPPVNMSVKGRSRPIGK